MGEVGNIKSKMAHGLFWSCVERFSVQGIQLLFSIFMARILSPNDYGVVGMLAIFMAVSQSIIDSGFTNALIRKANRTEVDYSTVFYFNIIVGLFLYAWLFFTAPLIAGFYKTPILTSLAKVVGLNLLLNSLAVVQRAKLTINIDFRTQARSSLVSAFVSGLVGLAFAYGGWGVWSLAIQSVANTALNVLLLWLVTRWRPLVVFSSSSLRDLFGYGSKMLLSGLLDTIYNNIYSIVVGKVFRARDLGHFVRADNFAQFPSVNLTGVLQRVTFPILSGIQDNDDLLRKVYREYLRLSAYVVFPLMMGLAAVANPFILVILTKKWIGAVLLLQILCFGYMWYPIHAINLNVLQVKGRSDLFLRLEIIKKALGTCILVGTIPFGVPAMCIGRVGSSMISLFINAYYTKKMIEVGIMTQVKDLLPALIYSLSMWGLVYALVSRFATSPLALPVGIVSGIAYYVLVSYVTRSQDFGKFLALLNVRRERI